MFRFVSSNALQSLRPVILQNLRNNSGILPLNAINSSNINNNLHNFQRFNSSGTVNSEASRGNYEEQVGKLKQDPLLKQVVEDDARLKLDYFKEQIILFNQYKKLSDKDGQKALSMTCHNILESFDDASVRSAFNKPDLKKYIGALNFSIYHNRTNRLTSKKNVDKDQYNNETAIDESILKNAVLKLYNIISSGEVRDILTIDSLFLFFNAMNQFQFYNESIDIWENGVNDNKYGELYLNDSVLSVILPIAYKINRFSYEEISRIYELNTHDSKSIDPLLLSSMGKIAISSGDYSKGLDTLESLIKMFENSEDVRKADYFLGDLHLAFIGSSKDIAISKHFFDKVVQYDLPYSVKLKVPHIQNLLENCVSSGESFDTILYFWRSTINHYKNDKKVLEINSRYSILNNTFFKIFFEVYPTLTDESFNMLKQIINIYNDIKQVDEVFLNTLITNYSWNDKEVFNQLLENYQIFNVNRTQVSYRVCLKKIGDIELFSNEEILNKWNESLKSLDDKKFKYIPMADWASIRDATIWSKNYKQGRTDLYWQIFNNYKNYFQDYPSCFRFVRNWMNSDAGRKGIKAVVGNEYPSVDPPGLTNLKPTVDFNKVYADLTSRR